MKHLVENMIGKDAPLYDIGLKKQTVSEKLSTGKKINHAADDVAGFAISISMESQIRGLDRADKNVTDGISLIQTADAALANVNGILDRMLELTLQASNGVYTSQDRLKMQNEVDQLIEEIDDISNTTNFNTRLLFDGSYGYKERPTFCKTMSNVEGIAHKDAEIKGPIWEGNIDLSKIKDGYTLIVNDIVFEFNSDNNMNDSGNIPITYTPKTSNDTDDVFKNYAEAIKNTVKDKSFGGKLKNINYTLDGSNLRIKLEASDDGIKGGETLSVSMEYVIPEIDTSNRIENPATDKFGPELFIGDIDLTKIVDGTTLNINGRIYEFDSDNIVEDGHSSIFVSDIGDSSSKAFALIEKLDNDFDRSVVNVDFFDNGDFGDFLISYVKPDTADKQPLYVEFNTEKSNSDKNMYITNVVSKKGVNIPEIQVRQAKRKEKVDFSRVNDGSVFIVDGYKFEFDSDGILSDSSNILVDISSADNTSEIAAAFKDAFDASAMAFDYILSVSQADAGKSILEFTSSESSTADGQNISIDYENISELKDDGIGLYLQVGSNSGSVNNMVLKIDGVSSSYLGIDGINVISEDRTGTNISSIYDAIDIVSENRAKLGAAQNRLEFIHNSLSIASENLSESRSRILDADMAKEMMNLIKVNVLEQSAQKILSMTMNFSRDAVWKLLEN